MTLIIILMIIWILILVYFKKINMHFFFFVAGSVGFFCFSMYFFSDLMEQILQIAVSFCLFTIGKVTHLFSVYSKYYMICVYHDSQAISFFIDYECSGFIETLAYISILIFYPVYSMKKKSLYAVLGVAYIFTANLLRIFIICLIVKLFGTSMFFFSHTVFARILFFAFMVGLYYFVFTRSHILKQRVGNLTYVN